MFAKMTPDTLDRPDSDTSRRLGNLDLAKFRDRRARTLGGATTREFRSTTPPAVAPPPWRTIARALHEPWAPPASRYVIRDLGAVPVI